MSGSWQLAISCVGAGILASLTPCVYPVMPLVIGYIGTSAQNWRETVFYSLGFYLGLVGVYTSLGLLAGVASKALWQWAGNPYVYLVLGVVCFFGALHYWKVIQLPSVSFSQKIEEELTFLGSLILGAGAGIMATACTSPMVFTILTYIAGHEIGPILGGLYLFLFASGMGLVYLVVGILVGVFKIRPKPGRWMSAVYDLFAWMLFGLGVYFVFKAGRML